MVDEGMMVFVDVIVDWCVICKVNEWLVFEIDEIEVFFDEYEVVVMKVDWINCDDVIV